MADAIFDLVNDLGFCLEIIVETSDSIDVIGMKKLSDVGTKQLVVLVAEQPLDRWAVIPYLSFPVDHADQIRAIFNELAEFLFALPQVRFHFPAFI